MDLSARRRHSMSVLILKLCQLFSLMLAIFGTALGTATEAGKCIGALNPASRHLIDWAALNESLMTPQRVYSMGRANERYKMQADWGMEFSQMFGKGWEYRGMAVEPDALKNMVSNGVRLCDTDELLIHFTGDPTGAIGYIFRNIKTDTQRLGILTLINKAKNHTDLRVSGLTCFDRDIPADQLIIYVFVPAKLPQFPFVPLREFLSAR